MVVSYKSQQGFTLLETMLVLAITGLMISGLLIGIGSSVNTQRYHDSVQTLKGFLQNEYSNLENVINQPPATPLGCDSNAQVTTTSPAGRGQSNCFIVGRYISIIDGDEVTANVNAYAPDPAPVSSGTDIQLLASANYTYGLSLDSKQTDSMEWGATIKAINPATDVEHITNIAILLLRSPVTGNSYTFVVDNPNPSALEAITNASIKAMITTSAMQTQILCVDSNGLKAINDLAIQIDQNASGPTSIEQTSNALITGDKKC